MKPNIPDRKAGDKGIIWKARPGINHQEEVERMLKRLLVLFLCLAMVALLMGCGETVTPEKASTEPGKESTKPAPPETFSVGEKVKMGDLAITVNSARQSQGGEVWKPSQGNIFVIVDCTIENLANEPTTISSLMMFKLVDSDGYNYTPTIAEDTKGSLDGELGSGRTMRGEVAFEVPADAQGLEFIFEPNVFGFGQAIFKLDNLQ